MRMFQTISESFFFLKLRFCRSATAFKSRIQATAFKSLFNTTDTFEIDYLQYTTDDFLDLMECFHQIKPLGIKSGDQVFLCTCCDAYQKYCCVESTALSLLYNIELQVPDTARLQQIKERENQAELKNPFSSKRLKEHKRKEDKAKEKDEPKWMPHMPVFASCAPGSAADLANQRGKLTSRNVMPAAAAELHWKLRRPLTPCRGPWTTSS
jgi:hypothetical protein